MADKSRQGRPEGGNVLENVRLNSKKRISINPDYVPPKILLSESSNETRKYYCSCCGKGYKNQKGNFLSGGKSILWKGNNGYLTICKSCVEVLMESLTSFYSGNEEHALKHLCYMFDWHYDEEASAMTLSQVHMTKTRVGIYPSKLCTRQVASRGSTYMDTLKSDYKDSLIITDLSQLEIPLGDASQDDDTDFVVTKAIVRTWGKGFTVDEYEFLEEQYDDWTTKNVCNTKTQEELFRNITLAQLDIRRARERGGKVSDAQKALQDLMSSANILPKQNADNLLADTQTFGTLIKKFEETDPIPEPDESWKDVDGIRRYMNTWFRGGLSKALKISNENSALYEEAVKEMEKYTVRPADVSGLEANDTSIFDAVGDKQNGDDS